MQPDLLHPSDLDPPDAAAWRALQAGSPAFASPLLGPAFARAVGEVRQDARVAVWRQDGRAVGFLPHHRRPNGFARPIGGPFSDYQALVSAPEFELSGGEALREAGLRALRVGGLIDPEGLFAGSEADETPAYRIRLDANPEAGLERLRRASRNGAKNHKRYARKLERDAGPLRLAGPDTDQAAFDRLLAWKSAQLKGTGLHDFLEVPWMRQLLQRLFEAREGEFQGMLLSLYAGEVQVAGQFGVRLGGWFHPWIAAIHPDYSAYSPGHVFLWEAVAAMPSLGLSTFDLGPG